MAEDRGLHFGKKESELKAAEFANNRAYVIGVNDYSNGIPPLRTAVADAMRLGELLERFHGYNVRSFPRDAAPSRDNMRNLLYKTLPEEVSGDDRVFFYFAGHGIALDGKDGPEGYLIPEDANRDDRNSFLSMTELHDALSELPCRHLLLVLDCCFAGAFRWSSSTRNLSLLPNVIHRERYERYTRDRAWQVLTSAAYDERALDIFSGDTRGEQIGNVDHSPFALALIDAIQGESRLVPSVNDRLPGRDGVITATELYLYLRKTAHNQKINQTPGLWPLRKHAKGEYILLVPGKELNLPPAPELNYENNPYRGLQSFEEKHSQMFFGRTRVVEDLCELVSSMPLLTVLGASGTGKSSVIKAGLLPRLRKSQHQNWHILPPIRPGKSPLETLASVAFPGEDLDGNESQRLSQLWSDENAFAERVESWGQVEPAESLLLLTVDQFEELVTLCGEDRQRKRFIKLLSVALRKQPERFRLIVILRSDFEPQFSDCELKGNWLDSRYVVPPMSTDDLREAIEGPASARVLNFEPASLVDRLIDEVIQTPGAMPLLSFTLSELYVCYLERRGDNRCLTLEDYEQLGGVAGSLRSRATELFDSLDNSQKATMQRIMLRMVSAQGGELTRRRVAKSELVYPINEENERVATVLQRLSEGRLVVEGKEVDGDTYVEPAHDALVRGWDKLLQWTQIEQEELTLRGLLTPAANDWRRHNEKAGTWHANPRLALLRRIQGDPDNWLNSIEYDFVRRSWQKRRNIIIFASSIVTIAFIALLGLTIYASLETSRANRQLRAVNLKSAEQECDRIVESCIRYGDEDREILALLSLVDERRNSGETFPYNMLRAATEVVYASNRSYPCRMHESFVNQSLFLAGGRRVLSVDSQGLLCLWHQPTAKLIMKKQFKPEHGTIRVCTNLRCDYFAVSNVKTDEWCVWDLDGNVLLSHLLDSESLCRARCSHDGTLLSLSNRIDGTLVFDTQSWKPLFSVPTNVEAKDTQVLPFRFPDNSIGLLVYEEGKEMTVWKFTSNSLEKGMSRDVGPIKDINATFDNRILISASDKNDGNELKVLNIEDLEEECHWSGWRDFALSPSAHRLCLIDNTDNLELYDLSKKDFPQIKSMRITDGYADTIKITNSGDTVLVGDSQGRLYVWDTSGGWNGHMRVIELHEDSINDIDVSEAGVIITASDDRTVRCSDFSFDLAESRGANPKAGIISNVQVSVDCRYVIHSDYQGQLYLTDREKGNSTLLPHMHQSAIKVLEFIPRTDVFMVHDTDGYVTIWSIGKCEMIQMLSDEPVFVAATIGESGVVLTLDAKHMLATWKWNGREFATVSTRQVDAPESLRSIISRRKAIYATAPHKGADLFDIGLTVRKLNASPREFTVRDHWSDILSYDISLDEKFLATVGRDKTVRLTEVESGATRALTGHLNEIDACSFSADSRLLATGDRDGTTILWSVQDGQLLASFRSPETAKVEKVAFVDSLLFVGYGNGQFKFFRTDTDYYLRRATSEKSQGE